MDDRANLVDVPPDHPPYIHVLAAAAAAAFMLAGRRLVVVAWWPGPWSNMLNSLVALRDVQVPVEVGVWYSA